jgi:hypothetical protein
MRETKPENDIREGVGKTWCCLQGPRAVGKGWSDRRLVELLSSLSRSQSRQVKRGRQARVGQTGQGEGETDGRERSKKREKINKKQEKDQKEQDKVKEREKKN